MSIAENRKLLFIGDSITDCGRARPVGEGLNEALGRGYVSYVSGLLGACAPERRIRIVNMGISGNTVRDLKARWQSDVLDRSPHWLSIMIGINDVWRHYNRPLMAEGHVSLEEYRDTLQQLIVQTRPQLEGLVLMTPYFLEPNRQEPMRRQMDQYGEVVKELAAAHRAVLVDVQAAFDAVMSHWHPSSIALDRVHPNEVGHMVLAVAFVKAIGLWI